MLKINVTGDGGLDNIVIYLEDPNEKMPILLNLISETEWEVDDVSVPIEGVLDYSLYVLAFAGTGFNCVITDKDDDKTITINGITGTAGKNLANEWGSAEFE